ncbi:MAG: helix-turn-helix domain-containing protein [Prolixibacteraceae bacterium]|nr:helix-turn-helix domain-containing protein [Prolixibacteraceae bacterium]
MSYSEFLMKLESLESQIKIENTGTAEELASKLGLSRRTVFNYLELLKDKGYNIEFCRYKRTYYFKEDE